MQEGKLHEFMQWIFSCLDRCATDASIMGDITPALCMILRREEARALFISGGGVSIVTANINKVSANSSAQQVQSFYKM